MPRGDVVSNLIKPSIVLLVMISQEAGGKVVNLLLTHKDKSVDFKLLCLVPEVLPDGSNGVRPRTFTTT